MAMPAATSSSSALPVPCLPCSPTHPPTHPLYAAASYEPLDVVLRHDRRRIPLLLDFVRYPHNPAVQAEAVRIATHLSGGHERVAAACF
jgi:hypothetical protein